MSNSCPSLSQSCGHFQNWADGEPDGDSFCGALDQSGEGRDQPCSGWYPIPCLCELPATLSPSFAENYAASAAQAADIDRRLLGLYLVLCVSLTVALAGAYAGWLWRQSRHPSFTSLFGAASFWAASFSQRSCGVSVASRPSGAPAATLASRPSVGCSRNAQNRARLQSAKGAERRLRARVQGLLLLLGFVVV